MRAELDFGNLSEIVNQTIEKNIQTVIEEQIRKQINNGLQDKLEEFIDKKLEEYVDAYLKETIIRVGGDYFKGIPEHESTIEDYMREYIGKRLEACDAFKVKKKKSNYYGNDYYDEISFEDFVEEKLKADFVVNSVVENKIRDFLDKTKRDINRKMEEAFTMKTQQMLSSTVCNILSANATYQQIQNNLKLVVEGGNAGLPNSGLPYGGK